MPRRLPIISDDVLCADAIFCHGLISFDVDTMMLMLILRYRRCWHCFERLPLMMRYATHMLITRCHAIYYAADADAV